MLVYALLATLSALVLISIAMPTLRRVWAFHLRILKYLLLGAAEVLWLRRFWLGISRQPYEPLTRPRAARLFCEDMGVTFNKFGQIIASSAGIFPEAYVKEFHTVLDSVRPFSYSDVEHILEEEFGPEVSQQLVDIDSEPLASASIAQVHTARLVDGTDVVVKVQRPGIARVIDADMRIMRFVAGLAQRFVKDAELVNPVGIVEDLAATLYEEIDFRKEAENLERFNEIMREHGHTRIHAPVPHWELVSERVLVMQRFFGTRVDDVAGIEERRVDAEDTLVEGMRAWFQCVVFHGFFHGDVHAGNLMLLESEDLGFLDFGIVGRFDDRQRYLVTDYIVAFATSDFRRLADVICDMGGGPRGYRPRGLRRGPGEDLQAAALALLCRGELRGLHPQDQPCCSQAPDDDAQRVRAHH